MREGVTLVDPATVWLDIGVEIGADTTIEPCAMVLGATKIGRGCRIGLGARLEDVVVGDGASIGPYFSLRDATIGAGEDLW
jgi:bifunctional UDP-N-acetylglucosamine pyrophosphorylase/glucosamine-1-phosphate N-acetyltransferase